MNQWRSVRTVFGSNKVPAHPTHASPFFTHIVSLASLKKIQPFWLLRNIIYPCVRVAGPARVLSDKRAQATSDRVARKSRRAQLATIGCCDGDDLRQHIEEQGTLRHLLQTNPEVYLLKANALHYFYEIMESEPTMPTTQDDGHRCYMTS